MEKLSVGPGAPHRIKKVTHVGRPLSPSCQNVKARTETAKNKNNDSKCLGEPFNEL